MANASNIIEITDSPSLLSKDHVLWDVLHEKYSRYSELYDCVYDWDEGCGHHPWCFEDQTEDEEGNPLTLQVVADEIQSLENGIKVLDEMLKEKDAERNSTTPLEYFRGGGWMD